MPRVGDDLLALMGGLSEAGVEFLVVGGAAAVLGGSPLVTFDLDIVHRRTPENVDRLLAFLLAHGAYHRFDLADRHLPPERSPLLGTGHLNLQTDVGKLDVLCELSLGEGYDQLLPFVVLHPVGEHPVQVLSLEKVIEAKTRAGRAKDKAALPMLLATLDEQRKKSR